MCRACVQGINVSGGQKQRIAIARAVYANPDVVLLDDPLSALDAKVGRTVFQNCIQRALKSSTRILATNQLQYVSEADMVVVLKDGRVVESGPYKTLMNANGTLSSMMADVQASDAPAKTKEPAGALRPFSCVALRWFGPCYLLPCFLPRDSLPVAVECTALQCTVMCRADARRTSQPPWHDENAGA